MIISHMFYRVGGIWGHHVPTGVMVPGSVRPVVLGVTHGDGVLPGRDDEGDGLKSLTCLVDVPEDEICAGTGALDETALRRKYRAETVDRYRMNVEMERRRRGIPEHFR